jgi:hypothetical protein
VTNRSFHLQTASTVKPQAARWAWAGRIPLGNISLFAGREGLGKTTFEMWLLAQVTRGTLEGDLHGQPADVIYATSEDSIEATLVPRFLAAGGDPTRIHFLSINTEENGAKYHSTLTLPGDMAKVAEAVDAVKARGLVLDPLVGFMDHQFNSHKDQHVRRILGPLSQIAATRDLFVKGLIHMNKGESQDALARISGSVGFTAAARSVLVLAEDPDDPEGERGTQRILAHAKCNLGRKMPSLTGRVEPAAVDCDNGDRIPTSRYVPTGESQRAASDLMAPRASGEERSARAEARTFLLEELATGPVASRQLKANAENAGLNWRTVERAKGDMPIRSRKQATGWAWELTNSAPINPPVGLDGVVGLEGEKNDKADKAHTNGDTADLALPLATPEE